MYRFHAKLKPVNKTNKGKTIQAIGLRPVISRLVHCCNERAKTQASARPCLYQAWSLAMSLSSRLECKIIQFKHSTHTLYFLLDVHSLKKRASPFIHSGKALHLHVFVRFFLILSLHPHFHSVFFANSIIRTHPLQCIVWLRSCLNFKNNSQALIELYSDQCWAFFFPSITSLMIRA